MNLCALVNMVLYSLKLNFSNLITTPSECTILKLSEQMPTLLGFVERRKQMMVIWGILIP